MTSVTIRWSGFAGQTAALNRRSALGRDYDVAVINPSGSSPHAPSWRAGWRCQGGWSERSNR